MVLNIRALLFPMLGFFRVLFGFFSNGRVLFVKEPEQGTQVLPDKVHTHIRLPTLRLGPVVPVCGRLRHVRGLLSAAVRSRTVRS